MNVENTAACLCVLYIIDGFKYTLCNYRCINKLWGKHLCLTKRLKVFYVAWTTISCCYQDVLLVFVSIKAICPPAPMKPVLIFQTKAWIYKASLYSSKPSPHRLVEYESFFTRSAVLCLILSRVESLNCILRNQAIWDFFQLSFSTLNIISVEMHEYSFNLWGGGCSLQTMCIW